MTSATSATSALTRVLLKSPYVEEFVSYGNAPIVPGLFYLSNSNLRNGVLQRLFTAINKSDAHTASLGQLLQTEWSEQKERYNDYYVYDIEGTLNGDLWELAIPRSSYTWDRYCSHLRIGDRLSVRLPENRLWLHVGYIHYVTKDEETYRIGVHFKSFGDQLVKRSFPLIRFHYNVLPIYVQAYALYKTIDRRLNPESFSLIVGAPRTGKTTCLIDRVVDVYNRSPTHRILVLTKTESSADGIAKRLIHLLSKGIARFHEWTRTVDQDYYTSEVSSERIWVTTIFTSRVLDRARDLNGFTHVFVDDASRISEPENMIPLMSKHVRFAKQITLVGDPLDVKSKITSLFHRLLNIPSIERTLHTRNYFSPSLLVHICSEFFYNKMVTTTYAPDWNALEVYGVEGFKGQEAFINLSEMYKIAKVLKTIKGMSIAISSAYSQQTRTMEERLGMREDLQYVYGVDGILECNAEILILSLVDRLAGSQRNIFRDLSICNQILCRPKTRLIVFGHPRFLQSHPFWKTMLEFSMRHGTYIAQYVAQSEYITPTRQDMAFDFECERTLLPQDLLNC